MASRKPYCRCCLGPATQRIVQRTTITHRCARHEVDAAQAAEKGWTLIDTRGESS